MKQSKLLVRLISFAFTFSLFAIIFSSISIFIYFASPDDDLQRAKIILNGNRATVLIEAESSEDNKKSKNNLNQFWKNTKGFGAGVFVDLSEYTGKDDGTYILTNNHVISRDGIIADKIYVSYPMSIPDPNDSEKEIIITKRVEPEIIGYSKSPDLALIKVEDPGLEKLKIGHDLIPGYAVIVIGHPFGFSYSASSGIISKGMSVINMPVTGKNYYIQTDAAINHGNSGGALLDKNGELIGIATAIYSTVSENAGVGFAIPISEVRAYLPLLLKGGEVKRAVVGIAYIEIFNYEDRKRAKDLALDVTDDTYGIYVRKVIEDSSAEKAGIKVGDVINAVDGKTIANVVDFLRDLSLKGPGGRSVYTIIRDGETMDLEIVFNLPLESEEKNKKKEK